MRLWGGLRMVAERTAALCGRIGVLPFETTPKRQRLRATETTDGGGKRGIAGQD